MAEEAALRRVVCLLAGLVALSCQDDSNPVGPERPVSLSAAVSFFPDARVVTSTVATVKSSPSAGSSILGTQGPAMLGTIVDGPTVEDQQTFWRVDYEDGADGWTAVTELSWPYFPPPEGAGGWRKLVARNKTPTTLQKENIRAKAGIDWDLLKLAYDYSQSFTTSSRIVVIRNGWVAGEWGTPIAYTVASVTKSLTGLAVARMFDLSKTGGLEQTFDPETPAYLHLPSSWGDSDPLKKEIRIKDLMTMSSGLEPHDQPNNQTNYLAIVLSQPVRVPPETEWSYASLPVDLLSIIVQNVTGITLNDFFNEQIAGAIGVPPVSWGTFDVYTKGSSAATLRPRNLARIGYLMMMNGAWNDGSGQRQIVSVEETKRLREPPSFIQGLPLVPTPGSPFMIDDDSPTFYGTLWWTNRTGTALGAAVPVDAYYARGYRETLLVVVPSRNLVVVRYGPKPLSIADFKREFMSRVMAAVL